MSSDVTLALSNSFGFGGAERVRGVPEGRLTVLREAFRHHVWATEQLLDVCATVPEEQLKRPAPGTYGSALDTLRHIVDADASYLFVISGGDLGRADIDADDVLARAGPRGRGRERAGLGGAARARARHGRGPRPRTRGRQSVRHATIGIRLAQVPPPRERPPQPDLHGAHGARARAAGVRRLGVRRGGRAIPRGPGARRLTLRPPWPRPRGTTGRRCTRRPPRARLRPREADPAGIAHVTHRERPVLERDQQGVVALVGPRRRASSAPARPCGPSRGAPSSTDRRCGRGRRGARPREAPVPAPARRTARRGTRSSRAWPRPPSRPRPGRTRAGGDRARRAG